MKSRLIYAVWLFCIVAAGCTKEPGNEAGQGKPATVLSVTGSERSFTLVDAGAFVEVGIDCDGKWTADADDADWLTLVQEDGLLRMTVTGALDDNNERTAYVTVTAGKLEANLLVTLRRALLLDVEFAENCTARDISSWSCPIQSFVGGNMATYYNEDFGRYAARFTHVPGDSPTSGYFKYDYSSSQSFISKISDGYSIEMVCRADQLPSGSGGMKAIGSMDTGGTGIGVTGTELINQIEFSANVDGTVARLWNGKTVSADKYMHIVGAFDKANGEMRLYVDGELVQTSKVGSNFLLPASRQAYWFCIGGNSGTAPSVAWNGDIVTARIYDAVLDDEEVARRYEKEMVTASVPSVRLKNVLFFPSLTVSRGGNFTVSAEGFASGDVLMLQDLAGGLCLECMTCVSGTGATATIPDAVNDGNYKILVKRGQEMSAVGVMSVRIGDESNAMRKPRIIAHRGVHNTGQTENSVAALRLAQEAGYYGSETDVYITADDSLMINHDGVLGGLRFETNTYETMRVQKLGNGEVTPSFYEYLMQARKSQDTKLIIEIKDHQNPDRTTDAVDAAVAMVKKFRMEDYVEWIAFSIDACARIREQAPDAVIGYLNGDLSPSDVAAHGFQIMDYNSSVLLQSHVDWIGQGHSLGISSNVWTVNTRSAMMQCISNCVDFITTDYPETAQELADLFFPEQDNGQQCVY